MAITVKDIQEKEFGVQKIGGYSIEEVDDFLDELAVDLAALAKENIHLKEKIRKLEEEASKVSAAPEVQEKNYDDSAYFKNLESCIRESLINAQRIADETVADARLSAQKILGDAEAQANEALASSKLEAETIKGDIDSMRKKYEAYRQGFKRLIESQAEVLKSSESLLG